MKYSFITQHKNTYPISLQCRVLGVCRSGYYHYRENVANKPADPVHREMLDWVKDIAESSRYSYGSRRIKKALNVLGYPVSRNKARKLMREAGVQVRHRKKFKVTTNSDHKQPVFDNLSYLLSTRGTHMDQADSHSAEQRIDSLITEGKLVMEPLTYIRGRSIPHQFMVVDEVQNLTPHEVKTIVSRVGEED